MKKIISILSAICMVVTMIPFSAYAMDTTPEISLDEFTKQLQELQAEHDDNYVSEITIENDKQFYRIDGEEFPVSDDCETTSTVTNDDFEIPFSAIEPFVELPESSTYSLDDENYEDITIDKETVEALGFEVDIENDKAVLTQPYQTERLIVKSKYDINPLDSVAIVEGYNDLHIVQFDNQESAKKAEKFYNNQIFVEYAEPDLVMSTMEFEDSEAESVQTYGINDYGYHLSWGSEDIGIDDYVDYLGDVSTLPEIIVGVIDTGIDVDHDFLKDRIIRTNYNISTSGVENDENDDKGHGTHVAGIIADNTTENVKIKGYKVLNSGGSGTMSDVITAFEYAVADGVDIVNMSLGTVGESKTFEKSINKATEMGVIVCVAAGNHGHDARKDCPANIEACLTVAAYGEGPRENTVSWPYWTNHGPLVDIVAPGMFIYSTYLDNGYETLSGTSMACPFVAASSALLLSRDIDLNTDGICDLLQENSKTIFLEPPYHRLYIAEITEYNKLRTEKPVFSMEGGRYSDSVTVELSCTEENAEIYYTLDGSRASKANGIKYTEPIVIDKVTKVHAAAYAGDKLKSLQAISDYYITVTDSEGNFEIDTNGLITAYNGTSQYLTIPDTINGITVTGIGKSVFSLSSKHDIIMIKFPDTLTFVDQGAFSQSKTLKSVYCKNLKTVGKRAFYTCRNLDTIDLSQLETVDEYGFGHCNLQEVSNDKLTRIERCAFTGLKNAVGINLPNVEYVGIWGLRGLNNVEYINLSKVETLTTGSLSGAFLVETLNFPELKNIELHIGSGTSLFGQMDSLKEFIAPKLQELSLEKSIASNKVLKYIYIPSVKTINTSAFDGNNSLTTVFAPSLETAQSLPMRDDVNIYLSNSCTELPVTEYIYNIIAPTGSYAEQYAKENCHTFIPSDSRNESIKNPSNVTDLGRSICTSVVGLRLGFTWNNIDEIENLASDIEYGFIYSQKGSEDLTIDTVDGKTVKKAVANNRVDHGDTTSFNLVISNIPKAYYDRVITARAYVCIDGMYFYSNMLKGSFDEVANLVLEDDEIDLNTKNAVNNLLNKEI